MKYKDNYVILSHDFIILKVKMKAPYMMPHNQIGETKNGTSLKSLCQAISECGSHLLSQPDFSSQNFSECSLKINK